MNARLPKLHHCAFAIAALAATACGDLFVDPAPALPSGLAVSFDLAGGSAGGSGEAFDRAEEVHIRLTGAGQSVVVDTTVALSSPGATREASVSVELQEAEQTFAIEAELLFANQPVFAGTSSVTLRQNQTTAAEVGLDPVVARIEMPAEFPVITAIGNRLMLTGAPVFATGDTLRGVNVVFSTPDTNILTISPNGEAIALAEGEARIVATAAGRTSESRVVVLATVTAVRTSQSSIELDIGEETTLEFVALDANGNELSRTATWSSSAPQIAEVDGTGRVTARAAGLALIIATVGTQSDTVHVTVRDDPIVDVIVDPASAAILVGQQTIFRATVRRQSGQIVSNPNIVWTSSNTQVATIDGLGTALGLAPGTTTVTASVGSVSGTATLTVQVLAILPSLTQVSFATTVNVDPAPAIVQLTSSSAQLMGLTAAVQYTSGTPGWLSANLNGSATPTQLVVTARVGGLATGTYEAVITIQSATAGAQPQDIAVQLTVSIAQYLLAVDGAGNGAGSIGSDPAGIGCSIDAGSASGDCSQSYDDGTTVTLTATPQSGSRFLSWSGDCSGSGSCQVRMTQARNVVASYVLDAPPNVVTLSPESVDTTSAVLAGIVSADGNAYDVWFEYGTDPNLSSYSASGVSVASGACLLSDCVWTLGLPYPHVPGAAWYYRIVARNSHGTTTGGIVGFIVP